MSDLQNRFRWAVDSAKEIFTWSEPDTLAYLALLATQAKAAIESGSYMGASAKVMATANASMHLWCVDKFMVAGTQKVTEYFLRDEIRRGQVELIVGDSIVAGQMLSHMAGKIDFVFVDDGHAVEDVFRDITCLYPLIRPGGIICGHDWEGTNDVAQGVLKFFKPHQLSFPVPRLWQAVKK